MVTAEIVVTCVVGWAAVKLGWMSAKDAETAVIVLVALAAWNSLSGRLKAIEEKIKKGQP